MSKLKTETNTVPMGRRVLSAALQAGLGKRGTLNEFFEHGQWWVEHRPTGKQWSVVDQEGGGDVDGFGFEVVTEGDEE